MWPYLTVAVLILLLFTFAQPGKRNWLISTILLTILILFVGLRFELGYDWLGYERLYLFSDGRISLTNYEFSQRVLTVEPLFYLLNQICKFLGLPFEIFLFIISAFNLVIIHYVCNKISPGSQAFVWLFYFCLLILISQFNLIRQSIASSFVLLSLACLAQDRKWPAAFWFLISLGFQISVLMFAPVFILYKFFVGRKTVISMLIVSFGIFLSGIFVGGVLIGTVGSVLPSFLGDKADNYVESFASGGLSGVSPLSMILVVAYGFYLKILMPRNTDAYTNIAILLTIMIIIAHLALSQFPSLWNRIMCVSLPWQLAALWRSNYFFEPLRHHLTATRKIAAVSAGVIAVCVMGYQLSRPESLPFVPYHSVVQVWLFEEKGDGRARAIYTINEAHRAQASR